SSARAPSISTTTRPSTSSVGKRLRMGERRSLLGGPRGEPGLAGVHRALIGRSRRRMMDPLVLEAGGCMTRRFDSVLDTVGNTPVIRIHRLAPGHVRLFVKAESFNPMGSVKDRLAVGLIEDAEQR